MAKTRTALILLSLISAIISQTAFAFDGAGGKDGTLAAKPAVAEKNADVVVYDIVYWSGGLKVKGKLFESVKKSKKKLPGVVFNHGGVGGVPNPTVARCKELAKHGYVAIAPSYRGEDGSEGEIEVAAGEVDDVINAVSVLRAWPGVDAGRIGMAGTSHGGIITLLAIERMDLRAAVCAYGVTNTTTWYKYLVDNGFDVGDPLSVKVYGKGPSDKPDAFSSRSPVLHVDRIKTPLLLMYGELDKTVPVSQGVEMADAMKAARKKYEMEIVKGGEHGFLFTNNPNKHTKEQIARADKAWGRLVGFLDKYLK